MDGERAAARLAGVRQRGLLARLALDAGTAVPRRLLLDDVWNGEPPAAASALRVQITRLRRVLEAVAPDAGDLVVGRDGGYVLELERDAIDAHCFQDLIATARACRDAGDDAGALHTLDEALTYWRGPALADLRELHFADEAARRLRELALDAAETWADLALAAGRDREVAVRHERLIVRWGLRERLTEQLALAMYRCGRQADALRAIDHLRTVLRRDLGLDPGPAVQRLEQAILVHDPALAAVSRWPEPGS